MAFTKIAISGATGNIGLHITNALLKHKNLTVVVLTRPDSLESKKDVFDGFKKEGAVIKTVDLKSEQSVIDALKGTEVLISAIAGDAGDAEKLVITAAAKAGVKRYYPSEYGVNDLHYKQIEHPIVNKKRAIRDFAVQAGLEVVVVYTGFFAEWALAPVYGFDFEKKTVRVVGDGNQKITFGSLPQLGEAVALSINHPQLAKSEKIQYFPVELISATFNDVIQAHEKASGFKWTVNHISIADFEKTISGPQDFVSYLLLWQAKGYGNSPNAIKLDIKAHTLQEVFSKQ
ncbi:hypothetical protein EDD86DRAFT_250446 [Gorgonomyces haynaldii]|nr:hypothetical protein EDD86DRAFT_250446 [Gorgonomyces haynaldii]